MLFSTKSSTDSDHLHSGDSVAAFNGGSFGSGIAAVESGSGTVNVTIDSPLW